MIRKTFFMFNKQIKALRKMKVCSESEHMRRAIDEYIEKYSEKPLKVSLSQS